MKIHIYKRTCTPMFIEAAFIIAKNWKPPKCLTTGEWNANCSLLIYWKVLNHSVMSDSSWPHGLWPTKLFCPWGFSRQEYRSGLTCLLPGDLLNPGIKPRSLTLHTQNTLNQNPWNSLGNFFNNLLGSVLYTAKFEHHLYVCNFFSSNPGWLQVIIKPAPFIALLCWKV